MTDTAVGRTLDTTPVVVAKPTDKWWEREFPDHPNVWNIYSDFKVFLKLVWKHLNLPVPTPVQLDIANYLQHGDRRQIIQGFRGVGKSYVTSAFVCWLLLRDPDCAIMVVSASKLRSDDFSTFTKRLISEMPILKHLVAKNGQRDSNVAFDVGPATAKHSPSVKSVGITGQLTGSRADHIVADDIEVPGNSETQMARDKISELVKEFDSVLKPGGRVTYLGTPQTEQSLYNRLIERGYAVRIWPSRIPDQKYLDRMGNKLAPHVHYMLDKVGFGASLDPQRFDDNDLAERALSYGASGFALQFLLDTSLSDANRYPLKFKDLIVMPLDLEQGPASVVWGPKSTAALNDVVTPGLDGDALYGPAFADERHMPFTGSVMRVDPSGRGTDETSWAIAKLLNATVYLAHMVGMQGGFDDDVLRRIANDAKLHKVNLIQVEDNFGQGMFAELLKPHLAAIDYQCAVEGVRESVQKEKRIIGILEPIMNQHRLVVCESVIRGDDTMVSDYDPDKALRYRMLYQMSRITKERGALANDDRLDAVAGAVGYWVDAMAQDSAKAASKAKDKLLDKIMKEHFENQINEVHRGPGRPRRRKKQGTFVSL